MTIIYTILAVIFVECILGLVFLAGQEQGYCNCLHDFRDEIVGKRPEKLVTHIHPDPLPPIPPFHGEARRP